MTAPPDSQVSPADIRALDARYRPFPDFQAFLAASTVDIAPWERVAAGLQQKQTDSAPTDFDRAVEVALRAAAVDTGALEGEYTVDHGFTMTVATQAEGWEEQVAAKGENVRRLFEAQLRGYELARDLALSEVPITEAWIRQLHTELAEGIDTYRVLTPQGWQEQALPKGTYKRLPNHVLQQDGTKHAYAPVDRVPDEMQRLVAELRTPGFEQAHPVLRAAYAHYALVVIHPFADLNGRAARALASTFLLQAQHVPLVVFADQRNEYLDALSAADQERYQAFVDFMFHCAIQATQLITGHLAPSLEERVEALRGTLELLSEISQQELRSIGSDLLGSLEKRVRSIMDEVRLPKGVDSDFMWLDHTPLSDADIEGYREVDYEPSSTSGKKNMFDIDLTTAILARRHTNTVSLRALANIGAPIYPLLIQSVETPDVFPIRLADVHPEETAGLRRRLDAWLRGLISEALGQLTEEAKQSLREAGL